VPVYDLGGIEPRLVRELQKRSPGQILWQHALEWTRSGPVAADLVTYLYQFNVGPWEAHTVFREGAPIEQPAVPGDERALSERILGAEVPEEDLADTDELEAFASTLRDWARKQLARTGWRGLHLNGSPVKSRRF
jgi:hypothetical protein